MKGILKQLVILAPCAVAFAMSAAAQTTVTTAGGTINNIPMFTGTATLGNSPVTVSGSNVGIGKTPAYPLDVNGAGHVSGILYVDGAIVPSGTNANESISAAGTGSFYLNGGGTGQTNIGNSTGVTFITGSAVVFSNASVNATGQAAFQVNSYTSGDAIYSYTLNGGAIAGAVTGYSRANSSWYVGAASYAAPWMSISSSGNVGIGTTSPGAALEVKGSVKLTASSNGGIIFQDGTTQNTAFIPANCGADYAESVAVTGDRTRYEAGDVLVIDADAPGKFLKSNLAYSTLVAGIYSTQPGFVGRLEPAGSEASKAEVPMAMVGRVPTKVSAENGPIKVGDLLVSSSTLGYAMKGTDRGQMLGAVIGKALGSLDSGTGLIEVLVTLQ